MVPASESLRNLSADRSYTHVCRVELWPLRCDVDQSGGFRGTNSCIKQIICVSINARMHKVDRYDRVILINLNLI